MVYLLDANACIQLWQRKHERLRAHFIERGFNPEVQHKKLKVGQVKVSVLHLSFQLQLKVTHGTLQTPVRRRTIHDKRRIQKVNEFARDSASTRPKRQQHQSRN